MTRSVPAVALAFCLASPLLAKDKNTAPLPFTVLSARTIAVVINPGSEVPAANPGENRSAQNDVELALSKWGRYQVLYDSTTADLIVLVRKGRAVSSTMSVPDIYNRPVVLQPNESGVGIGVKTGNPGTSGAGSPQDTTPHPKTEYGSADDTFAVYFGQRADPLDAPAVWRISGKDALRPPTVRAVEEFRKAVEETEKQQKQKQQKKP
jgi:hypothetical protein